MWLTGSGKQWVSKNSGFWSYTWRLLIGEERFKISMQHVRSWGEQRLGQKQGVVEFHS